MKPAKAVVVIMVAFLLAGCGIQPGPVQDSKNAPTGIANGVTLYFGTAEGALQPQYRDTGRLGTIAEALGLLLTGPGPDGTDLLTGLPTVTDDGVETSTRVGVTPQDGAIRLRLPLAFDEVSPLGIDQLVCTALGVHVQSGGSPETAVQLIFTIAPEGADHDRHCPLTE